MADLVTQYIAASDNASDYADHLMDGLQQDAVEDIDDLFRESTARDAELWALLGVNDDTVVSDYDSIPREGRDLDWTLGLSGISAAATTQFLLDNSETTIVKPVAYREQVLDPFNLTRAQLVQAGKRGTELATTAGFARIQPSYLAELNYLSLESNAALYETLLEYEAILPIDKQIANASGYVARMTNLAPGSVQFKEEVAGLVDANSTRNIKAMNRRAIERVHSFREAEGRPDTLMAWLVEGGKNTCSYCLDRAGEVETYEYWITTGLPGAEVCKGGDSCRCHLAALPR